MLVFEACFVLSESRVMQLELSLRAKVSKPTLFRQWLCSTSVPSAESVLDPSPQTLDTSIAGAICCPCAALTVNSAAKLVMR